MDAVSDIASTWQIHHLSLGRSEEDHEIPERCIHPILGLSSNPRRIATVWNFLMQIGEAMTVSPCLDVCVLGDVSWKSKKQTSVALSTAAAKYVALVSIAQETL